MFLRTIRSHPLRTCGVRSTQVAAINYANSLYLDVRYSSINRCIPIPSQSISTCHVSFSTDSTTSSPTSIRSPLLDPSGPPLPIAIVGSGPAAFYSAKYLLREFDNCRIDMFERLPVPFGLVRFGVAPDHPDVKSVTNDFNSVANDTRFAFWGNVELGKNVSIAELRSHYSIVILAYGASSERSLAIPGAHLKGIYPSRHFVNWYNAHPEHGEGVHNFDLEKVTRAVIVGQGNVALDCARVLLSPLSRLQSTDISLHALKTLADSQVQEVHMIGRRGAIQSAFSIGELREVATSVDGVRVVLHKKEIEASENEASLAELEASRPKKRKHELVRSIVDDKLPTRAPHSQSDPKPKELHVRYLLNPKEFLPDKNDPTRVGAIVLEKTSLLGGPEQQEATSTGELVTLETGLVLTSIGYKSVPVDGVPFDSRKHIVPNIAGRVQESTGHAMNGVYTAGWLKRGPSGIIATNIMDARETIKSITADVASGVIQAPHIGTPLPLLLPQSIKDNAIVSRDDWARIDAAEQALGLNMGKPRVKLASSAQLLKAAHTTQPVS